MSLNAFRRSTPHERLVAIGQNELKPVAGLPPSFVHDKDVIAKIAAIANSPEFLTSKPHRLRLARE
jgi:hypothetical protein